MYFRTYFYLLSLAENFLSPSEEKSKAEKIYVLAGVLRERTPSRLVCQQAVGGWAIRRTAQNWRLVALLHICLFEGGEKTL